MTTLFRYLSVFAVLGMSACSLTPPTSIHQPMTAKPVPQPASVIADGSIYHAGVNDRPLFEDKRARNIGDILTINLVENTAGSRSTTGTSGNTSSAATSTPSVTKNGIALLNPFTVNGSSTNKSASTGAGAGSETLTGSITVTVVEVLSNGNLQVSGEKQVGLNQSDQYIRFSGVVNPTTISNLNVVQSTQVADAHIEFKSAGEMNEVVNDARTFGFLGRFFKSVLPY